MKRRPADLDGRTFDVVVVGGGISGACVAFDAATRGMSVALLEKDDFGAATSAASSKLLHGGLRYLQQLRFGKVRESAFERLYFQNLAPHLTRWVPFVVPTFRGLARGKPLLAAGMLAYEVLCLGQNRIVWDRGKRVPPGEWLTPGDVRRRIPGFDPEDLTGGRLFYESHMVSSERMTLAFIDGAVRAGAVAVNHAPVEDFLSRDGRVEGVLAVDRPSGGEIEVGARLVVNAAGPWIRSLNERLAAGDADGILTGLSRGSHIVTPPLTDDCAVALPTRRESDTVIDRGGRHVFVIPWRGHSLIGTTYAPFEGSPGEVGPTDEDVRELLAELEGALGDAAPGEEDVAYAYAGLYPLTEKEIRPEVYQGASNYRVLDHESHDGVPGLISVFGAKYTTARLAAERAVDRVAERLGGDFRRCRTREIALPAGEINDLEAYRAARRRELRRELDVDVVDYLVTMYGRRLDQLLRVLRERPELADRLLPERPELAVEPVHAARSEMAVHLSDFVFRRSGLGTLGNPGRPALERVALLMGQELGWDPQRTREEVDATLGEFPL